MDTVTALEDLYSVGVQLIMLSVIASLTYHIPQLWKTRNLLSALSIVLIGAGTGFLIVQMNPVVVLVFFVVQSYRIFSLLRIVKHRLNPLVLGKRTLRSDSYFAIITVGLLLIAEIDLSLPILVLTTISQLLVGSIFFAYTLRGTAKTAPHIPRQHYSDAELPTLTVAIPARNETNELTDCLQSVLATDYPKLEVLVLDDCSQDKTSDIIRKFAHRGVRFVKGKQPPKHWVAKTYAYDQLFDDTSGDLVLFCGIDVRFEKDSLRNIVSSFIHTKQDMISVLPLRREALDQNFLIQPMRYWRELVIPRWRKKTPPALSTCWLIKRDVLQKIGGFEGVRQSVRPEQPIARRVAATGSYAFVRSSAGLGVSSVKSLRAQISTAVRTRYPEHKNRPEDVMLTSMWYLVFLIGPSVSFFVSLWLGEYLIALIAFVAQLLLVLCHYYVHAYAMQAPKAVPMFLYPISVFMEVGILNYSMWAYEFSEVIWKGRNVCLPVLQVSRSLPPLEPEHVNS